MGSLAWIGIGSNQCAPLIQCYAALELLDQHHQCVIKNTSRFYRSAPVGITGQPWFVNAVVHLQTDLSAYDLWHICVEIEVVMGRVKTISQGPRIIDLDLLLYDEQQINSHELVVPHPRLQERRFVLQPLNEIFPAGRHPVSGVPFIELLQSPYIQAQCVSVI